MKKTKQTSAARAHRRAAARSAAHAVGWVAAVFSAVVAVLLLVNRVQTDRVDALNSPALLQLIRDAAAHPGDAERIREVRAMDRLARRAFFSSQAFARRGALLLLAGVAVLLAAMKTSRVLAPAEPEPRVPAPGAEARARGRRIRRIALGAAGVAILAAAAALFSMGHPRQGPSSPAEPPAAGRPAPAPAVEPGGASDEERAVNWPGFRGFRGLGVAAEADPPTAWNVTTGEGVLWKVEVPRPGFSSPVVWGDRVWVTGADATARELYCFDAATGTLRWTADATGIPGSPATMPEVSEDTGYAAPTPATDGRRVFAAFATGDLIACDLDGRRLWAVNVDVPQNPYGYAQSPLAWRDLLLVAFDDQNAPRVLALQGATGEEIWSEPRDTLPSWASPIVAPVGDAEQLVLVGNPNISAYNPRTGEALWQAGEIGSEVGASPAAGDGWVYAGNEYAELYAVDAADGSVPWSTSDDLPDVCSPLAVDGLLFMGTSFGLVTCRDARSGDQLWEHQYPDGFYASPVCAAGRIYLFDRKGVAHIFRAARTFEALGEAALGEPCVATPAPVGKRLYVRGARHLFALGAKP